MAVEILTREDDPFYRSMGMESVAGLGGLMIQEQEVDDGAERDETAEAISLGTLENQLPGFKVNGPHDSTEVTAKD